mmetsp:Transcript_17538/g.17619  ORF Transcript_17538/g.17619 Transcript_17538/m.17619 type:complete len:120 (-) Transcript_17538:85-444(-)
MDLLERAHSSNHIWKILEHMKLLTSIAVFTSEIDESLHSAINCEQGLNHISKFMAGKEPSPIIVTDDTILELNECSKILDNLNKLSKELNEKWAQPSESQLVHLNTEEIGEYEESDESN